MRFRKNEEAVSPVIGVILMVAITVILAAVIAAFVFGMGTPIKTPQANLQITKATTANGGYIAIEHKGGDSIALKDVKIVITQASNTTTFDPASTTAIDKALTVTQFMNISNLTGLGTTNRIGVGSSRDSTSTTGATGSSDASWLGLLANANVKVRLIYNPSGQVLADIEAAVVTT